MDAEQLEERRARQSGRKARETHIGTDSTGAEYWLVPFPRSQNAANRKFEIRKSKKQVPKELAGMWTDAASATRTFEAWQDSLKAKRRNSKTSEK